MPVWHFLCTERKFYGILGPEYLATMWGAVIATFCMRICSAAKGFSQTKHSATEKNNKYIPLQSAENAKKKKSL